METFIWENEYGVTPDLKGPQAMKMFIWEQVTNATSNYHSEGGIAVVAHDFEAARAMILHQCGEDCTAMSTPPDKTFSIEPSALVEAEVIIFPNSGCC